MLVNDPDLTSLLPPPGEGSGTSCRDLCPLLPWSDRAALLTLTLPLKLVGYSSLVWVPCHLTSCVSILKIMTKSHNS